MKNASADAGGVCLMDDGRQVLVKWHKLRRTASDPPFSLENLRLGLKLGASLEVDARLLGDGTWVCLHDDMLDEETTGKGPVAKADRKVIARLRIAGSSYPPPLLADVAAEISRSNASGAYVQIDLKEAGTRLTADALGNFATVIAPVAGRCLLSGTDWAAVERLGGMISGLRLGYDPYDVAESRSFHHPGAIRMFIDEVFDTAPHAAMFYLYHRFVARALDFGVDPLAPLKRQGAKVDVWTLDPDMPEIASDLRRVIAAGADQITTNDPVRLARLWAELT